MGASSHASEHAAVPTRLRSRGPGLPKHWRRLVRIDPDRTGRFLAQAALTPASLSLYRRRSESPAVGGRNRKLRAGQAEGVGRVRADDARQGRALLSSPSPGERSVSETLFVVVSPELDAPSTLASESAGIAGCASAAAIEVSAAAWILTPGRRTDHLDRSHPRSRRKIAVHIPSPCPQVRRDSPALASVVLSEAARSHTPASRLTTPGGTLAPS